MQELLAQLRARAAQQATKAKAQSQQAQEPTPITGAGDAEPTAAPTAEADLSSHVAAFTNTTDYLGRTPLMLAVIGGRTKALQVLLADPSTDVEARAKVRSSARVRRMNTDEPPTRASLAAMTRMAGLPSCLLPTTSAPELPSCWSTRATLMLMLKAKR